MKSSLALFAVCGLAAGIAQGQNGSVINISGATLLENYVKSPASTNDYIDVDGNGIAGSLGSPSPQQLASGGPSGGAGQIWVVQYRVVGSVAGFIELTQHGSPSFVTTDSFDINGILGAAPTSQSANPGLASAAYVNRTLYISNGVQTGPYNAGNPGGAPVRATSSLIPTGVYAPPPVSASGGIRIDIAPLDVSTAWATQKPGSPVWSKTPLQGGYGSNPRVSVNTLGTLTGAGLSSQLPGLNGRNLFDPNNVGAADANTIFETELALAPIAPVVNFGTGVTQVTMSELQHLFGTGRGANGENLMVVTRDVGSGTRNAFQNSIGQDPSWGVGDNIGALSTTSLQNNLGAAFQPTNKGSNGNMEATLRNGRLAIGYVGTERGVTGSGSGSWLTGGALEIADVKNDIYGGTAYVRPTTTNIVHNNANGWVIAGQSVLATMGDPRAESISAGGNGLSTPKMQNAAAASYLNNIRKSIANFVSVPNALENEFMPGEFAATQFLLLPAIDFRHPNSNPASLVANPEFTLSVQNYTLSNNVHNNAAYTSFNNSLAGKVPTRTTGTVYSDGVANGGNFKSQGGAAISYGSTLTLRNKIAGDFNGNAARDAGDVLEMLKAFRERNAGPAWVAPVGTGAIAGAPGTDAVIEILGDFQGDGNFTSADVRYFADGLFLVSGNLDRRAGFAAVDNAWSTLTVSDNFFGYAAAHSTGEIYKPGDARADVSGAAGIAPGWAPVGADGVINASDIDYVYAQFKKNAAIDYINGEIAAWSDLDKAVHFDLSADMNGDLVVDQNDVDEIITCVLNTSYIDVNLDGVYDAADDAIVAGHYGQTGWGFAGGDTNGDGVVDNMDLCAADTDRNGVVDLNDYFKFFNDFDQSLCAANIDGNPGVDLNDFFGFLNAFDQGCNP